MTTTTTVTPVTVIDAAIERLEQPDGYTRLAYHASLKTVDELKAVDPEFDEDDYEADPDVEGFYVEELPWNDKVSPASVASAHCAIGGVEHAMWKLSNTDVIAFRGSVAYRTSIDAQPSPTLEVYEQVMVALNFSSSVLFDLHDIEQVSRDQPKEDVLIAFRDARRRLAEKDLPPDMINPTVLP